MSSFEITETDECVLYLKSKDKRLEKVINKIGSIECRTHENHFEFVVSQIVGQMLSNKVAHIICARLKELCGDDISAEKILLLEFEDLKSIGLHILSIKHENQIHFCRPYSYTSDTCKFMNYFLICFIVQLFKTNGIAFYS